MALTIPLVLPDLPRYEADERLELVDVEAERVAYIDLINAHVRALIGERALGSPDYGEWGWVLQGLKITAGVGLQAVVEAALGVAIDSNGRLLIHPGDAVVNLSLNPSTANIIYAYLLDVESMPDGRRRWDRGAGAEASYTVNTRLTPTVGFFVDTSLRSHTIVNGVTVPLVVLASVTTDVSSVTGVADSRPFLGNANQSFTFDLTQLGLGVKSVYDMYSALATRIKQVFNAAGSWAVQGSVRDVKSIDDEVIAARAPTASGLTSSTTLKKRIEAARTARLTVGPTDTGDYNGAAGLAAALNRLDGQGDSLIVVKPAIYDDVDEVLIDSRTLDIKGQWGSGTGTTRTIYKPLTGSGKKMHLLVASGVTIEDIFFDTASKTGEWEILLEDCQRVTFRRCEFHLSAGMTQALIQFISANTDILFEDCVFTQAAGAQALFELTSDPSHYIERVTFRNCVFDTNATVFSHADVQIKGLVFDRCYVKSSTNTVRTFDFAHTDAEIIDIEFTSCFFENSAAGLTGSIRSQGVPSDNAYRHRVKVADCYFLGFAGVAVEVGGHLLGASVERCTFYTTRYGTAIKAHASSGGLSNSFGCRVQDNTMISSPPGILNNYGIQIVAPTPAVVQAFDVSRNYIKGFDYGIYSGIYYGGGLAVTDNKCLACTVGGIVLELSGEVRGLKVKDNLVQGGGTTAHALVAPIGGEANVAFAICIDGPGDHYGTIIEGNVVNQWALSMVSALFGAIFVRGQFDSLSIRQNTISEVGNTSSSLSAARRVLCAAILALQDAGTGKVLAICDNTLQIESWGAGIYFDPATLGSPTNEGVPLESLKIDDNTVYQSNSVAPACGIKVGNHFGGMTATDTNIDRVSACDNKLYCPATKQTNYNEGVLDLALSSSGTDLTQPSVKTNGNTIKTTSGTKGIYHRAATASVVVGNMVNNAGGGSEIDVTAASGSIHVVTANSTI